MNMVSSSNRPSTDGKNWQFPELRLSRGPAIIGHVGQGQFVDLAGYAWAIMQTDTEIKLLQAVDSNNNPWMIGQGSATGWAQRNDDVLALSYPLGTMRHIGLCFDQAARPVVTYENNGIVYIAQFDSVSGQYTLRNFAGVDPVLVFDFEANYYAPESDVLLFYLSTDRTQMYMRVQREQYNTPRLIHTFPSQVVLDQATVMPYQFQLLGSLLSSPESTGVVLRSDIYPVYLSESIGYMGWSVPGGVVYAPIVIVIDAQDTIGNASWTAPATGEYKAYVEVYSPIETLGNASWTAPATGEYKLYVIVYNAGTDTIGSAGWTAPATGEYKLYVIVYNAGTDVLGNASWTAPATGEYVLA